MKSFVLIGIIAFLFYLLALTGSAYWLGSSVFIDWILNFAVAALVIIFIVSLALKKRPLAMISILMIITAIIYPKLSHEFHLWEVERRKQYVTNIAPLLDKYKAAHGNYPTSLDQAQDLPQPPFPLGYGSFGESYYFIINDPQDFDYDEYDSKNQTWRRDK